MYINTNPKSKAQIKRDIKSGVAMRVYQPNDMFNTTPPQNGTVAVEGPHFPKPHKWYGTATLEDGVVVAIK